MQKNIKKIKDKIDLRKREIFKKEEI